MNVTRFFKPLLPLSASVFSMPSAIQAQTSKPNIILIVSDDHTTQAISSYGSTINKTPQIDRIAQNGIRFNSAFCTNAVSGPSRACILTGKLTHRNGMINNEVVFDTNQTTLPHILQQHGYQTAVFGKWHLKSLPSGFSHYEVLPGQGEYMNPDFIEDGRFVQKKGYVTHIITDDAIAWLKQQNIRQPFYLMIQHKAPHRPWLPELKFIHSHDSIQYPLPDNFYDDYTSRSAAAREQRMRIRKDLEAEPDLKLNGAPVSSPNLDYGRLSEDERIAYIQAYEKRNQNIPKDITDSIAWDTWKFQRYLSDYLSCIESVDEQTGRLLDFLKETKLDENTLIIYTSDQGFFLGEHGWFDKRFMYEESLRMPLLMQFPGHIKPHTENNQLVMNIDFAPSILEWAGISIPPEMQGKSFVPYLQSDSLLREFTYYHYFEYPGEHHVKRHVGIRSKRYKLIHFYYDIDAYEMYDLNSDPHEMHSIFGDSAYATVQATLLKHLHTMQVAYGDTSEVFPQPDLCISNAWHHASYTHVNAPSAKYPDRNNHQLLDGIIANSENTSGGLSQAWVGFEGNDIDLHMNIPSSKKAAYIELSFLDRPESWIFKPLAIHLFMKGKNATKQLELPVLQSEFIPCKTGGNRYIVRYTLPPHPTGEIQIQAKNKGICPAGHPGAGKPAWLFIDEIRVKPCQPK